MNNFRLSSFGWCCCCYCFISIFSQCRCKHGDNRTQTVLIVWTDKNIGSQNLFCQKMHTVAHATRPTTLWIGENTLWSMVTHHTQTHARTDQFNFSRSDLWNRIRRWQNRWCLSKQCKEWCFDIVYPRSAHIHKYPDTSIASIFGMRHNFTFKWTGEIAIAIAIGT